MNAVLETIVGTGAGRRLGRVVAEVVAGLNALSRVQYARPWTR